MGREIDNRCCMTTTAYQDYAAAGVDTNTPISCIVKKPSNARCSQLANRNTTFKYLWTAMRITSQEFQEFAQIIRENAREHLDIEVPFQFQDEAMVENFLEHAYRASKELMQHYEAAWPIKVYTERYLSLRMSVKKERRYRCRRLQALRTDLENIESRRVPAAPTRRAIQISGSDSDSDSNSDSDSDSDSDSVRYQGRGNRRQIRGTKRRRQASEEVEGEPRAKRVPTVARRATTSTNSGLVKFLGSLQPVLTHVIPLLAAIGITDDVAMEGVKRWPRKERKEFFSERLNVMVTPLELMTLQLGFDGRLR